MRNMGRWALLVPFAAAVFWSSALQADAIGDNNLCYAQFSAGDNEAAIGYCSRAIQSGELSDADLIAALINRGVAYKNTGNLQAAIDDYTRALRLAPRDALLYQNRANARRAMGNYDAALADIEKATELEPKSAAAWYVRGAIAEDRGNLADARRYYLTALGLDPENSAYKAKILGSAKQEAQ
mgnify:FL=1|tara:strand:+ start:136 stop:684 length:549 start_codon:yes stop_codon:yes gene_type:complete